MTVLGLDFELETKCHTSRVSKRDRQMKEARKRLSSTYRFSGTGNAARPQGGAANQVKEML